ncbi:MAG: four helix bundle protein [Cyclobacteriaceae bacterium]|jgi:four helix bundle protein|nr:four helix bundle protein [Cyclobacteriaceae bacterium]
MNRLELERRLVDFSILVINLIKSLPEDRITNHLCSQLLRSATSPALNYGEALGAESRKDFVHKLGVVLKELRETLNCLKILVGTDYIKNCHPVLQECHELVSIFVKSVETSRKGLK